MYTEQQLQQLREAHPGAAKLYKIIDIIVNDAYAYNYGSEAFEFKMIEAIIEHVAHEKNQVTLHWQKQVTYLDDVILHLKSDIEDKDTLLEQNAATISSLKEEIEDLKMHLNKPIKIEVDQE